MSELTTERLEKRIKNCIEVGNGCVMLPVSVAEELLAYRKTVNHLLDNDGSRGKFSAVQSYDAREDLERLLAPIAQQNEPQNIPENIPAQPVSEPYKLPDGWVMVPQQIFLDASDIESICSQCGDGHKSGYGDFTDGLLWVGDIQCDNGTIMHGLHISSSDYQEEGGLTLAEFKAPVQEQK
ncbi:hypothetical protein ACUN3I_14465 [Hafnia alvei]|uniref:hypothetical protein n=1 Tax=Hafnia alvei TaxID=569 RepID=UPI004044EC8F